MEVNTMTFSRVDLYLKNGQTADSFHHLLSKHTNTKKFDIHKKLSYSVGLAVFFCVLKHIHSVL